MSLRPFDIEQHGGDVRRIYEASFPESVRAPWDTIAHHRDDEELLVLVDDVDGEAQRAELLVRYFAVDGTRRSQGHGARLLDGLRQHLESRACTALLLDVEAPDTDPAHAADDQRRIAFYERHGLRLLPVPDYAPPEHGATGEQVALLLMGMALDDGAPLEGDHLAACVHAVYRYRYGVDGPTA